MSASDALLIFLDEHSEFEEWLRLSGGDIVARGAALEGLPALADPETGEALAVVAVVPGEAVSVHWLEVPDGLAPAQAVAAARLMASEVSIQPLGDMHVAVGPEVEGGGMRAVALVPGLSMAGWLGRLQAQGLDPDMILPATLLLLAPEQGFARYTGGDNPIYRGQTDAFAIEPELADTIVGGMPVAEIDSVAFEAGLADAVADPPVNLRQGVFAKRRRWKIDWALTRRLAALAFAILAVTLAIQIVAILRYTYAADALEAEANRVAATALPRGARTADPGRILSQRAAALQGGAGYRAIGPVVFGAVQATVNVEIVSLVFDRDGSLRMTVQGDSPATIAALKSRIEASGLTVTPGAVRGGDGRPTMEMSVSAP